jgi:hypothetical protein
LHELRTAISSAVRQGVALAAVGLTASCAGKSERLDDNGGGGSGISGNGSTSGATATGGSPSGGGNVGVEGGSSGTAGTESMGGSTSVGGSSSMGGSSALGGTAGSETGGAGSAGTVGLEPYPMAEVGCFGPTHTGGYEGQCCISARCYTPDAGACVGPPAERPPIPLPPGSGTCGCSPDNPAEEVLAGPYAPNPDGMASPEGTCCYLVGSIGCEGRPLLVDGAAIVAPLSRRGDWCANLV